uniref:Si:dkey-30c15.10 n=1 Tax=Nothobranchius kuhntae TaxID=321403 RepID=A0A1A8ID57_NOTKU
MKDGLKRRRLEAAGRENQSPKPSTSGRLAALQTKPDTPMIPSVRSRVQLLAQRRDVRCFSDPGAEGSSVTTKDLKGHLLGEEEFNERLERFKAPVFQASPTPAEIPVNPSPRARSRFVSSIQQKLQCSTTPSSKQAFSIRQERERELNQLSFQPISENAWLKRSNSDSSLTSVHDDDDTEMKDGSFIEMLKSATEGPANPADDGLSSHDETGTAEVIDKMFEEVLECAGNVDEKERVDEDAEDCDSGIGACSGDKDKMDTDVQKETSEEATEEEKDESKKLDSYGDELLTFPPSVILSPLSKSVEAAVTPMRLAAAQESSSSSLLPTPEETSTPPADFAPLYSVDAYRTQRQSKLPATQGVTPAVQRRATEVSEPQPLVNTKERIAVRN